MAVQAVDDQINGAGWQVWDSGEGEERVKRKVGRSSVSKITHKTMRENVFGACDPAKN